MKLKEIYKHKKSIEDTFNGVVSVTNRSHEVCEDEIRAYVFTKPIVKNFFNVLNSLKTKNYEQIGMWISGYYGSGKSHFIKYLGYCFNPEYKELALARLNEATVDIISKAGPEDLGEDFNLPNWLSLYKWLQDANVDTCAVNLEQKDNKNTKRSDTVLEILWNLFNEYQGLNGFDIPFAMIFEKPLLKAGQLQNFKDLVKERLNSNWDNVFDRTSLQNFKLPKLIEIFVELIPDADKEGLKQALKNKDYPISIEAFANDLRDYLSSKPRDFRLIFLVDEVSAFLGDNKGQYLNLQELVTRIAEVTDKKVWIACTAQQDLKEILENLSLTLEETGKIMGRFPVKSSLESTKIDYITQKRILEKNDTGAKEVGRIYEGNSEKINAAFRLPAGYAMYKDKEEFIANYPVVPFQFTLMKKVLDNFQTLQYVAKEVKGNERSIIRIVHDAAKKHIDEETGRLIAFDELYRHMFEGSLQPIAVNTRVNADNIARGYKDPEFALRVVNVLFMVCNLADPDKRIFPASLDNLANLFVDSIDSNRAILKDRLEEVLEYLTDKNVIRKEEAKGNLPEIYVFYSQEEVNVANAISSQSTDSSEEAEILKNMIQEHFPAISNKVKHYERFFSVGEYVGGRRYLSHNADVDIEFKIDNEGDVYLVAQRGYPNRITFYMGPQYRENKRLTNQFHYYCQVNSYMKTPATNEENQRLRDEFSRRANTLKEQYILPEIKNILDTCPVIIQQSVVDNEELGNKAGNDRFKNAMNLLLHRRFEMAGLVADYPHTSDKLAEKIKRPVQPDDYTGMNLPLPPAEKRVENYLLSFPDKNVADIVEYFSKEPYGWDDIATLYTVNELVRRHKRDYTYKNSPDVSITTVASNLARNKSDFTVKPAHEIPLETINNFKDAWKEIFGPANVISSPDSTQIVILAKGAPGLLKGLWNTIKTHRDIYDENSRYKFMAPIKEAIELYEKWYDIRDIKKFLDTVIEDKEKAKKLRDISEQIIGFVRTQLPKFKKIVEYVKNNSDNFEALPEESKSLGEKLKGIENQGWPVGLSEYIDAKNEVDDILEEKKQTLRNEIKKNYQEAYAQLCEGATQSGVDISVIKKPEDVSSVKVMTESISQLKLNLNTDDYFKAQFVEIQKHLPKPPRDIIDLELNTRTTQVLTNEAEVNAYIAEIKKHIMKEINAGHNVIITK